MGAGLRDAYNLANSVPFHARPQATKRPRLLPPNAAHMHWPHPQTPSRIGVRHDVGGGIAGQLFRAAARIAGFSRRDEL